MAMNLPTPPTQGPRRVPVATRGSLVVSSAATCCSEPGASAAPATSGMTPLRSAMPPSAVTMPGRSAPAEPKRTSFKALSWDSGRRQAGRSDGFELFVGEDEFLVAQRLGFRGFAARDLLHEVVYLAADVVEFSPVQDAAGVHVHVVGHALVGIRIGAHLDDGRDRGADHRAAPGGEQDEVR